MLIHNKEIVSTSNERQNIKVHYELHKRTACNQLKRKQTEMVHGRKTLMAQNSLITYSRSATHQQSFHHDA